MWVRTKACCVNTDTGAHGIFRFVGTRNTVPTIAPQLILLQILFPLIEFIIQRDVSNAFCFVLFCCSNISPRLRQPIVSLGTVRNQVVTEALLVRARFFHHGTETRRSESFSNLQAAVAVDDRTWQKPASSKGGCSRNAGKLLPGVDAEIGV